MPQLSTERGTGGDYQEATNVALPKTKIPCLSAAGRKVQGDTVRIGTWF